MRIAIFSDTFFPDQINGAAHVAFHSAKILTNLGHEVMVFTVSTKGLKKFDSNDEFKFKVFRIPSVPLLSYAGERLALPLGFTLRKVKKFNPDIIHTHMPFALGWEAVWAAKLLGKPLVGTHHTFFDHYLKHIKMDYKWFKKPSWKFVVNFYNRCDLVLSPSRAMAEGIKKHGLKKPIQVVPNPVDTVLFHPRPTERSFGQAASRPSETGEALASSPTSRSGRPSFTGAATLIYMGRVSYEKSIDLVLQAFFLVLKSMPTTKFMIVGDGPERATLEKLTRDLGIQDNVLFTGVVLGPGLVEKLQAADLFLTASKSENMPISVLEAMACGLPVIGVDALGIPEIVQNNINGFIVPPDEPNLFAEKILELLQNPSVLEKFSQASRQLSLQYSERSVGQKLEDIYKQLIK